MKLSLMMWAYRSIKFCESFIYILSVGLNRAGFATQIRLLKHEINSQFVMKNDYSFGVPIVINSPALFRAWRRGI